MRRSTRTVAEVTLDAGRPVSVTAADALLAYMRLDVVVGETGDAEAIPDAGDLDIDTRG